MYSYHVTLCERRIPTDTITTTMPQKQQNHDSNGGSTDATTAFRREYAAALAEALRASETSEPSTKVLCDETYLQLCTDDPLVSERGCRALATALLDSHSSSSSKMNNDKNKKLRCYAPSDRLVQGIQQICQRISRDPSQQSTVTVNKNESSILSHGKKKATSTNVGDDDKDDGGTTRTTSSGLEQQQQHESFLASENRNGSNTAEATQSCAYGTLAWVVFGRIPLLCCLSNDLTEAASWIGSYRGPPLSPSPSNNNNNNAAAEGDDEPLGAKEQESATTEPQREDATEGLPWAAARTNRESEVDNDGDSLVEVWAAESDPSDYGYDSGWDPQQQMGELDAWATSVQVDPHELSQPPSDTQWSDVIHAVTSLLRELQFSKLSGLTLIEWRREKMADYLTQLILTLLLPHPSSSPLFHRPSLSTTANGVVKIPEQEGHWQQLALQPLHVFRDAVAMYPEALMGEYLSLLQHLLQVDHQLESHHRQQGEVTTQSSTSHNNKRTTIAPATWIGLSCLSSVCRDYLETQHASTLRTCILQLPDDLCAILEKSEKGDATATIPWVFLPLFRMLSSRGGGGGSRSPARLAASSILSNTQAQVLLNSGLFRQWLLWWERQSTTDNSDNTNATSPVKHAMEYNLFHLCLLAPTLLGKYAWRFPGFAAEVTNPTVPTISQQQQHVDKNGDTTEYPPPPPPPKATRSVVVLLWNLLGIQLAEQSATSGGGGLSSGKRASRRRHLLLYESVLRQPPAKVLLGNSIHRFVKVWHVSLLDGRSTEKEWHWTVVMVDRMMTTKKPTLRTCLNKMYGCLSNFVILFKILCSRPVFLYYFAFKCPCKTTTVFRTTRKSRQFVSPWL